MTTAGITIGESNIGERDYYANVDTVLDDDEEDEEDDIHRNYTNTNKEKLKRIHTLRRRMTTTTSVDFVVLLLLEPVTTTTTANRTAALRSQDFGAPQCTCSAAAVQFSVEYCTAAVTSRVAEVAAAAVAGTEWHLTRYLQSYFILSWQGHPIRQHLFISTAHTAASSSSSSSLSSLGGPEVMLKQCQIAFYARVLVILTAIKQKDLPPPRRGESPSWPPTAQWGPCCRTSTADCGR